MVTSFVDDLIVRTKIEQTAKNLGVAVRHVDPRKITETELNDTLFLVDYMHPYGFYAARTVKNMNKDAKIIGFYPHVRGYMRTEAERDGLVALTNSEFTARLKDILQGRL